MFWWEGVDGQKISSIFLGLFLIQPIILFLFVLIFLLTDWRWSENAVGGVELVRSVHSLPKTPCKYYNSLTKAVVHANRDQKITKTIIQTIMTSTRSSDYAAIRGGGNGIGGGSQSSRRLASGLPPGGEEEEDDDSTPVAFDIDDGNCGGQVEVNGECEGNGNSDGPVDNNNNNDYNIDNNDNNNNGGRAGQKRKHGMIVEEREKMEGEEEMGEEAECVTFLSRKSKLGMDKIALFEYFNTRLEERAQCPNKRCTCLAILGDDSARSSIAKYLTWFEQRNKYEQDLIIFKWFRYSTFLKPSTEQKRTKNKMLFCLPYINDGTVS